MLLLFFSDAIRRSPMRFDPNFKLLLAVYNPAACSDLCDSSFVLFKLLRVSTLPIDHHCFLPGSRLVILVIFRNIRHFSDRHFFKNKYNIYDLGLLVIMIVTLIGYMVKPKLSNEETASQYIALVLIALRYCSQLIRLVMLVWRTRDENRKI